MVESAPFSHAEWAHSNLEQFRFSKAAVSASEALRSEARQLVEERRLRTVRTQADSALKIHERVKVGPDRDARWLDI